MIKKKKKKPLQKVGMEGTHFSIIKAVCEKPTANIILNSEKLKARSGKRQGYPFSPFYSTAHSHHFYST